MIKAAVLTISDRCSRGQQTDTSGPAIRDILIVGGVEASCVEILPDDREAIARRLETLCDNERMDVVITTGGTGLGPRDVTPEATLDVCEKTIPGLMETTRAEGYKKTPNAILSRGVAAVRNKTIIINLPGSTKAVTECMEIIMQVLDHAVKMIAGGGH
jgi:molybdenum cofactor synthesis domain-containing protein